MRWAISSPRAGAASACSTFSVGFGPELFGFTDRKGTRWKLSAIPLGGYVKFLGDENEASAADRDALARHDPGGTEPHFAGKAVGARAFIVAAGPVANFILAIVDLHGDVSRFRAVRRRAARRLRRRRRSCGGPGSSPATSILSINGQPVGNSR